MATGLGKSFAAKDHAFFYAGRLFAARFFEPAMMGLVYLAYGQKMGGRIGLHFLPGANVSRTVTALCANADNYRPVPAWQGFSEMTALGMTRGRAVTRERAVTRGRVVTGGKGW